jgi:fucose 4-O-acetylase-like acetyltransferase
MQRQQYWDILKGLGIIAVVVGHTGSPLVPFVYMYHIALFFFISGYFYKDIYSADPTMFIAKRTKGLYWPFVKYGLGFLIFHNVLLHIDVLSSKAEFGIITTKEYDIADMLRMAEDIVTLRNTEQMAGAMWFLPSLFVAGILFCLIRYVSLRFIRKYALFVTGSVSMMLFGVGIILAQKHVVLSMHADVSLVALPIFFAGYLLNNLKIEVYRHWGIALFSAAFLVFTARKYGFFEVVNQKYVNPWLFILASCAGIYMNMYLGKVIENISVLGKIIAYIGQCSLKILALHFFAFKIVSAIYITVNKAPHYWLARFPAITGGNGWWIAYAVIGVGLPVILNATYVSVKERFFKRKTLEVSA